MKSSSYTRSPPNHAFNLTRPSTWRSRVAAGRFTWSCQADKTNPTTARFGRDGHASVRCLSSWRKSPQCEDARAEALLRGGWIHPRQDSLVAWQLSVRCSHVKRGGTRTQGGGCNGRGTQSLFLHDRAAN